MLIGRKTYRATALPIVGVDLGKLFKPEKSGLWIEFAETG